jgi:sulfite exporter TauE/SafE/copper chaperone CopZ
MNQKKISFKINDMVCESCEKVIEKSLVKLDGIKHTRVSYANGKAEMSIAPEKVSVEQVIETIKEAGYHASETSLGKSHSGSGKNAPVSNSGNKFFYILLGLTAVAVLAIAYLLVSSTVGALNISVPQLDANTSIALIFLVGLLTGFHCIGMCGGFVLSYTAKARKENPKGLNLPLHAQYAGGKIISYSVIGGIFGLIGSFFVFTPQLRATVAILAGIFLILFSLRLLNIFPILRKFSLPQRLFSKFRVGPLKTGNGNPIMVGLMNGLFIACGPLQAMYVLAATTGSFFMGASMLLAFAIGTLIPMMGFGVFASFMSHGFQNQVVRISAAIVLVMGLLMINNGLALTGSGFSLNSITNVSAASNNPSGTGTINTQVLAPYQQINMDVLNSGWSPNSFVLKKGVPVKWVINGKELNGCNSAITVPAYNLEFKIQPGTQTIEFTPNQTGIIQWSCWMGMIRGTFVVRDDVGVDNSGKIVLSAQTQQAAQQQATVVPARTGGCGCGGGNSGGSCH